MDYLAKAKEFGNILVVGLNSDESTKMIKGQFRPINSEMQRVKVLSALSSVNYIVLFGEKTPVRLVRALMPNVYVKVETGNGRNCRRKRLLRNMEGRLCLLT